MLGRTAGPDATPTTGWKRPLTAIGNGVSVQQSTPAGPRHLLVRFSSAAASLIFLVATLPAATPGRWCRSEGASVSGTY